MPTVAILFFEGTGELDAIRPWEVFSMTSRFKDDFAVFSVSEKGGMVTCAKGLKIKTQYAIDDAPAFDTQLVPGGRGTRVEIHNETLLSWIADKAPTLDWLTLRVYRLDGVDGGRPGSGQTGHHPLGRDG